MTKLATACVAFLTVLMFAVAGGAIAVVQSVFGASSAGAVCAPAGATATSAAGYGPQQMANAAVIVAVGKRMNVPERGSVIAVATAITESQLQNLDHGDRDSVGLFQQRPSQGWGTVAQIMDPTYSSEQFYRHLLAIPNWQNMPLVNAAQAVQHSGFPDRYGTHEHVARQIVGAVVSRNSRAIPEDLEQFVSTCTQIGTGDCVNIQAPTVAAMTAITYACQELDVQYKWGGNGPGDGGFDCSGLTKAAYAAAGITLPRTAQLQYNAGPRVTAGEHIRPGDLVFFGTSGSAVTHVGIAISATAMINAPDFGQLVRIDPLGRNLVGVTRPAPAPTP